ncbi:MAG: hypothetical protein IPQ19_10175 [Bacteroidetes bacterium]|nr:hypothetical protein [Bacteroidota bacterium]
MVDSKNIVQKLIQRALNFFQLLPASISFIFSSNGRLGYGGLDIFYSKPYGTDKWTEAKNMGFLVTSLPTILESFLMNQWRKDIFLLIGLEGKVEMIFIISKLIKIERNAIVKGRKVK